MWLPEVLVTNIMNRAPICNPILKFAFGSSPPPPQVGFIETVGVVIVVVALALS